MSNLFRDIAWIKVALYITPLCYLFYSLFSRVFTGDGSVSSRANFLIVWLIVGFILSDRKPLRQPVISALIFCVYTFFILMVLPSNIGANYMSALSCIFVWPLALYNSYNIKLKRNDIEASAILLGITCNIIAFLWFTGIRNYNGTNVVLAYNSVYYILVAILYVFLIRNIYIQLLLLPYPLYVLISSGKTTCVILALSLIGFYVFNNLKRIGFIQKIGLIILVIIGVIWGVDFFDINEISASVFMDLDNGGSGRTNIWSQAINVLSNLDLEFIIGHGYGATPGILNIGAHNDLLEIFIDFGLIGLVLYLCFFYQMFVAYKRITPIHNYRFMYFLTIIVFTTLTMVSKLVGTQIQFLLFTTIWGMLSKQKATLDE